MNRNAINAVHWARNVLADPNTVILDTETTGLRDAEIVQISVIDLDGNTLLETLVRPVGSIPVEATRVHGITLDMVQGAPGWGEVTALLQPLLTGKRVVVYNAVYDRSIMHQSAEKAGTPKVEWKQLATFDCAMEEYARFFGDWNDYRDSYTWQKLSAACDHLGINQAAIAAPVHSALGDCLRTLAVIRAMAAVQL